MANKGGTVMTDKGTQMEKSVAVAPTGGTALTVLQKTVAAVPTPEDVEKLEVVAAEKLQALVNLAQDSELTEAGREKVLVLVAQAQPIKPGMEEITTTWTIPRVQIVQPTTQASAKPESARPGDMFTTSGALLEKPFGFIPLYFSQEHIMFTQGERTPACSSPDAKLGSPYGFCQNCAHLPFGQQNGGRGDQKKTDCQNQIVVAVLSLDLSQVYMVQFAKTSRGAGSALISLAKAHPFPWKQSYLLSTEKKSGDLGVYHVYKIEPTGKDNGADALKVGKTLSELYSANRKKFLAEFYRRASTAAQTAVLAEAEFNRSKLDLGLGDALDAEPDLSTLVPKSGVARSTKVDM